MQIVYKIRACILVIALAAIISPCMHAYGQSLPRDTVKIPQKFNADSASFRGDTIDNVRDTIVNNPPVSAESMMPPQDSTKGDSLIIKRGKAKEEKPKLKTLDTYFFPDSIMKHRVLIWTINRYLNTPEMHSIDTTMNENKTELPFYRRDVGVTYLGPTGSAALLHDYFKRTRSNIYSFMDPYSVYSRTPDDLKFYNSKGPYTDLGYYTSGSKKVAEDNVKVIFAENITPEWNVGLSFIRMGARGTYQYQRAINKTFSLFTSYTGKRYVAHAGYIYNGIKNQENGGIVNDKFLTDTVLRSDAIPVKLHSALNRVSSNTYFLTHSYGVPISVLNKMRDDSIKTGGGTMVYFGHSLEYSRYKRMYTDGISDTVYSDPYEAPTKQLHYYDNYYLSPIKTYDSSFASTLDNRVFIRLQPYSPTAILSKIDGGAGYAFDKYYIFDPSSYLHGPYNDKLSTGYVYGNAQGMLSKYFAWNAFLKYYFAGYRVNDLYVDASARVSLYPLPGGIHVEGRFVLDNREQTYYTKHYYSNHFRWNNNFDKTTETRIEVKASVPDWQLEAGFKNSLISKPVYFGTDALPSQSADVLNITAVYAQKNLQWWLLHLDSRLLFQLTSNSDIMPLPAFSGNATFYLQSMWVKNVLNTQIGFDAYYNTAFYDYAYNPATGMFHTQNEKKIGNYPWIDVFANFKWKRANIYVKFTNVFDGMIGERNYFSALHYPRNGRMFRMGVNWYFFN